MESVCSNAVLIISALKSNSGEGGCFGTKCEIEVPGNDSDGSSYTLIARHRFERWERKADQNLTPLFTRAWCF